MLLISILSSLTQVSDRPLMYLLDTPGISVPHISNMHVGMKVPNSQPFELLMQQFQLAMCATLKDELVGINFISDYLLW